MAKLTKSEIVDALADKTGMTKKDVNEFIDSYAELALDQLNKNEEFTLHGIGKLKKKRRKARKGRNPQTGEPLQIPAKNVIRFKASKPAVEEMN